MSASERLARDVERVAARLRREEGVIVVISDRIPLVSCGIGQDYVEIRVDYHSIIYSFVGGKRDWPSATISGRSWPERLAEEAIRILRGGDR